MAIDGHRVRNPALPRGKLGHRLGGEQVDGRTVVGFVLRRTLTPLARIGASQRPLPIALAVTMSLEHEGAIFEPRAGSSTFSVRGVSSPPMSDTARYRVLRKIAHGGMAEIFLALQLGAEGFEKPVVLKRILPGLAADPSFVRMLVDEAHIASTLNHSNLVQVLDLRHSGSEYFLVLEFVDGWSLEQVRRRAQKARLKLPLPIALYVVGLLCRALAYVHTRTRDGRPLGIVHRDVTPQNVLLSAEGEVKLADFGIAKALGKREKSATGVIKGKFAYMSPEQAAGEELDGRSDLFSVGTLLYVLTTGKKPFDGATDLDVIMQVRKAKYERPSTFMRDFNPEVERFIARALRANRNTRFQTAEQMADRIEAIASKLGQPSGPAALKRWLETLTARDGIRSAAHAPHESEAPAPPSGTIEVLTGDLELEVVSVEDQLTSAELPGEPPTAVERRTPHPAPAAATRVVYDAPTLIAPEQSARLAAMSRSGRPSEAELDGLPSDDDAASASLFQRFGRWLRRLAIRTFLVVSLAIGAAYLARPHLPPWITMPVEGWLRALPGKLTGGRFFGTPDTPAPPGR
jgi:serine/threonine protein kinase